LEGSRYTIIPTFNNNALQNEKRPLTGVKIGFLGCIYTLIFSSWKDKRKKAKFFGLKRKRIITASERGTSKERDRVA